MTTNNYFRGDAVKKVWLNRYPADVPAEINPDRYQSLVELFEHATTRYADQPAFINMGEVMTYRKLEERSRAFAAYLQEGLGLQKGDRVALMMPNLLQYPVALFGILRAGMIVVNVNPLYTPRELEHQLNDSGAAAIVIVSNFAHTLEKVVAKTQVKHVILTRMGDQLSTAKGTLVNFVVKYIKRLVPKYHLPDAISFRSALQHGYRMQYVKPEIVAEDLAFLQYTAVSHFRPDHELPAVYRTGRAKFADHQPTRHSRAGEGAGEISFHRHDRGQYPVQRLAEQQRVSAA